MDYYEELGLAKTASIEEIRQSYRQLARLIHPDQQPDQALRRLAEIQMKRLNLILEVLTDPARRRDYDLSLLPPPPRGNPPPPRPFPAPLRRVPGTAWIWMAAALVGGIGLAAFFASHTTAEPPRRSVPAVAETVAEAGAETSPVAPRAAPRPPAQPAASPMPSRPAPAPVVPPPPPTPSAAPLPAPAPPLPQPDIAPAGQDAAPRLPLPALTPPPAVQPQFAGTWIYQPGGRPNQDPARGLYAPEYIEIKIAEQDGRLRGAYRARYVVTDRAISPAVVFHFEGQASPPLSTLRWNGAGGASGRITLKLLSLDSLEISWTASRLSSELSLVSGAAKLVRQRDP